MAGKVCAECGSQIARARFASTDTGKVARVCSWACLHAFEAKVPGLAEQRRAEQLSDAASEREQMSAVWGEVA